MNSMTHMMIGDYLCRCIEESAGVKLQRGWFLYGNVLPDFHPMYLKRPHKPNAWADFLQSEIAALSTDEATDGRYSADFSTRLGVLCHLYADFHCYPHTKAYNGGSCRHVRYEWDLYRYLCDNKALLTVPGVIPATMFKVESLTEDLEEAYAAYLAGRPSYENDIHYTLQVCSALIMTVIEAAARNAPLIQIAEVCVEAEVI
ncbi:zinc dependent phospholipase C family protein [Oscillospiraceae bacterium CM]|nr:zinc dependent phospholipase C family protein [Oscillospiraceae bacterium CM]